MSNLEIAIERLSGSLSRFSNKTENKAFVGDLSLVLLAAKDAIRLEREYADIEPLEQQRDAYHSLCMEMAAFLVRLPGWDGVDERCAHMAMDLVKKHSALPQPPKGTD